MNDLIACLAEVPQRPLGTIVHVGAGSGAMLADYAELAPGRVLLIEGDPDTAASLRAAAKTCPWAEVIECVVAATAGDAPWHRYNLPRFNGLHVPASLEAHYPRLHALPDRDVSTVAFTALAVMQEPRRDDSTDVLVLDVPGQEASLLSSLRAGALQRFSWLLVRRCALDDAADPAANELAGTLEPLFYRAVRTRTEVDPAWPIQLWRLDVARWRADRLRRKVAQLEEQLVQARQSEASLRAQYEASSERSETLLQQVEWFATQRDEQRGRIDELEAAVAELTAQRDALQAERDRLHDIVGAQQADAEAQRRQLHDLEAEHRATTLRHTLLQEELARAEEQLAAIKELLASEQSP